MAAQEADVDHDAAELLYALLVSCHFQRVFFRSVYVQSVNMELAICLADLEPCKRAACVQSADSDMCRAQLDHKPKRG